MVRRWGGELPQAGAGQSPAHLETVKRPKTRGFWGSLVRRRKTSSAKRGVEVRHWGAGAQVQGLQVGILDAMPTSLGVWEGAAMVEQCCSQLRTGLCTHRAGRSGSRCPGAQGWSTPGGP